MNTVSKLSFYIFSSSCDICSYCWGLIRWIWSETFANNPFDRLLHRNIFQHRKLRLHRHPASGILLRGMHQLLFWGRCYVLPRSLLLRNVRHESGRAGPQAGKVKPFANFANLGWKLIIKFQTWRRWDYRGNNWYNFVGSHLQMDRICWNLRCQWDSLRPCSHLLYLLSQRTHQTSWEKYGNDQGRREWRIFKEKEIYFCKVVKLFCPLFYYHNPRVEVRIH